MSINTGYKDDDGLDLGVKLIEKEYMLSAYSEILPWLKTPGLWICGYNFYGQLGDNTIVDRSSPVQTISGGTNWKQVSGGQLHTAAIKTDGTLWLWGTNSNGQLGDNTGVQRSSPVQTISSGTNWKQISCGYAHTSAIKTDGTLWVWGSNTYGELGDNTISDRLSPIQTLSGGNNWKQVCSGTNFTAATKNDGTLWVVGRNDEGQCGDNTTIRRSSPIQTISGGTNWKHISCSGFHIAAIKTDGTLWVWGRNDNGQIGDGTIVYRSSPVQTLSGGNDWKRVSCGLYTVAAIKNDGTLWIWGSNFYGELGDNTSIAKSSPVQTVCGGTNWKQISSSGRFHTAAIKTDGSLWTWGYNNNGQLGDNTIVNKSSPVQTVCGGYNWKQVDCGNFNIITISDFGDV